VKSPGEVWGSFSHDPRDATHAVLRASDADREIVRDVLTDGYSDGRLDRTEYDERSAQVLAARTLGELPPIVVDLLPELPVVVGPGSDLVLAAPADLRRMAEESWLSERRNALWSFVGPTLICWAIWVAVNWNSGLQGAFPWPLIVMAATGVHALRTVLGRREYLAAEVRRLEKKQAKAKRSTTTEIRETGQDS